MRYNCVNHPASFAYPHHEQPAYLKKKNKKIGMRHNVLVSFTYPMGIMIWGKLGSLIVCKLPGLQVRT